MLQARNELSSEKHTLWYTVIHTYSLGECTQIGKHTSAQTHTYTNTHTVQTDAHAHAHRGQNTRTRTQTEVQTEMHRNTCAGE
jgi:hypothetical protein